MPILSTFVTQHRKMNQANERIFDAQKIEHCTQRMAYQIYEANIQNKTIFLAGIANNGLRYAKKIRHYLELVSPLHVELIALNVDKKELVKPVQCEYPLDKLKNQSVVVIDDVLNTGGTLMYAVKHLLDVSLKQLNTAVLVNRNHKKFPIKADFKGVSLSTTINEHVTVVLEGDSQGIYLS